MSDTSQPVPTRRGRPSLPAALGAAVAVFVAVASLSACGLLRGLFGPPEVELREAYAGEGDPNATFDHADFSALLARFVDAEGLVDYAGLKAEQAKLDAYLARLATAKLDALGRDERLALLINAYNAFTLRLILDHHPLASIRDVPGGKPWDGRTWRLGGHTRTLNQLEHEQLRPKFREPRLHFAVNCASVGCPPLRREAYVGARLDAQLEEQTRWVHGRPLWCRYDAAKGVVHLTKLYDWYGDDFVQTAGSPLAFAARYVPALAADLARGAEPTVRFMDYDWRLNERAAPR